MSQSMSERVTDLKDKVTSKVTDAIDQVQEKVLGKNSGAAGFANVMRERSIWAVDAADRSKPQRPTSNRGVVVSGTRKAEIRDLGYPKMETPNGQPVEHGVILKVVATNICGSDLHMYRGHIGGTKNGLALGHEITGQIVEMGRDVERWDLGDFVSVPFNVACGKCDNCREQKTSACLKTCGELGAGGAYGFPMMGGWRGGQCEYHFVPYADFQLLRLPKDRAIPYMKKGLAFLSDIFPTGYNGALQAGVKTGSIVYIAGAGPVGLCAAQASYLLGAGLVIVADVLPARLKLAESIGCKTIDLSKVSGGMTDSLAIKKEIEKLLPPEKNGEHSLVDASIDCVGYECCGIGREQKDRVSEQVLNTCFQVTKAGGKVGVPGIYALMDPSGANSDNKLGIFHMQYGLAWNKGLQVLGGQCPVMAFNLDLAKAILYDRVDLGKLLNAQVISLEQAVEAYKDFDSGSAVKYIIDPHGMLA